MVMFARLSFRRHFLTKISSCENDHSSAETSLTGELGGGVWCAEVLVEIGVGDAEIGSGGHGSLEV